MKIISHGLVTIVILMIASNSHLIRVKKKDAEHAWSVADFEMERPHLTMFVREKLLVLLDNDVCRRVFIRAPVKSGKREIVEWSEEPRRAQPSWAPPFKKKVKFLFK